MPLQASTSKVVSLHSCHIGAIYQWLTIWKAERSPERLAWLHEASHVKVSPLEASA